MAMNLRLGQEDTEALRRKAEEEGTSMQDVAVRAIREYVTDDRGRFRSMVTEMIEQDRALLDRLAQ